MNIEIKRIENSGDLLDEFGDNIDSRGFITEAVRKNFISWLVKERKVSPEIAKKVADLEIKKDMYDYKINE